MESSRRAWHMNYDASWLCVLWLWHSEETPETVFGATNGNVVLADTSELLELHR